MMKKKFLFVLVAAFLSLAACGTEDSVETKGEKSEEGKADSETVTYLIRSIRFHPIHPKL
ncbi:hypothetical protein [Rossellomorea sp. BNER]|uniref:hypothetical protein n=1 Tax=Rossellomorea sp. BNER TaxID=2962031 RepID=UPI003AF1E2FB|nr:hypothetical protein [Rossellomorea sp. BNER]